MFGFPCASVRGICWTLPPRPTRFEEDLAPAQQATAEGVTRKNRTSLMESTLPTRPTQVHHDAPTAVVLAHATLALDEVVKVGHEAEVQWSLTQKALAVMVLSIMVEDGGYVLPPVVREALGGNFYEGPLLTEAQALGWIGPTHNHVMTDAGPSVSTQYVETDDAPFADVVEEIARVGRVHE